MKQKLFKTALFIIVVAAFSFTSASVIAQSWPETVGVGNWGSVSVYRGETESPRAFPYLVPADDTDYPEECQGAYVFEYKLYGNLSKLTREMFSFPYLPDLGLSIEITAWSGGNGVEPFCQGDDKFNWGAGFCDKDILTLQPQPKGPPDRIWFCSPHGDTGPIDIAVGTNTLQPGKDVILGPGFDEAYLPVTTEQFTKVFNVCLKTIQNSQTKCIEDAYLAPAPSSGACANATDWVRFDDSGFTGAIYTGTPSATEECDQTLSIPPQEDLDRILATWFPAYTVHISYTDALIDKSVKDTGSTCPSDCIRYEIRGYLKCKCP